MSSAPDIKAQAEAAVPNTVRLANLQAELVDLLKRKRQHEVARDQEAAAHDAVVARLLMVEAALGGAELGFRHAEEAAAMAAREQPK